MTIDTATSSAGASNGDAPQKKKLTSQACDRCKSKKRRCDGERPCATCIKAGVKCTYDIIQKKRGPAPGTVVGWKRHGRAKNAPSSTSSAAHSTTDSSSKTTKAGTKKSASSRPAPTPSTDTTRVAAAPDSSPSSSSSESAKSSQRRKQVMATPAKKPQLVQEQQPSPSSSSCSSSSQESDSANEQTPYQLPSSIPTFLDTTNVGPDDKETRNLTRSASEYTDSPELPMKRRAVAYSSSPIDIQPFPMDQSSSSASLVDDVLSSFTDPQTIRHQSDLDSLEQSLQRSPMSPLSPLPG
ncbi:hypothetical protein HK102_010600, partial [Quaeritorhiza haematococci]